MRYQWGGESPSTGFDCSGLVHYAYNQAGIDLPRKTAKGYVFGGNIIPQSQAQPGDLVAFTGTTTATWASMWEAGRSSTPPAPASRSSSARSGAPPHVFVSYR
ncbi:C40 family peptidase [Brachybacterium sacelli]|uniref:C40 family peptidase n=1 Tax=Brachybacterium sacelli TaxID=173364 RepID=UPI003616018B